MQVPGTTSLVFLAYLLLFLPWAALRSAHRLRQAREGWGTPRPFPSRKTVWTGTLVLQGALAFLAWITGSGFGYHFLALPAPGVSAILLTLAALAACFALRAVMRAIRPEGERRKLLVYALAPRSGKEWALWIAAVLLASVAEEAAYRGVGMAILWDALGSPWLAALICATAFALGHWTQGWKSAAMIFAMALLMHALVGLTWSLFPAILVHAVYDLVAGTLIAREARRHDAGAAA
jgi:membrane protease YdiL (CAAX protease family)